MTIFLLRAVARPYRPKILSPYAWNILGQCGVGGLLGLAVFLLGFGD